MSSLSVLNPWAKQTDSRGDIVTRIPVFYAPNLEMTATRGGEVCIYPYDSALCWFKRLIVLQRVVPYYLNYEDLQSDWKTVSMDRNLSTTVRNNPIDVSSNL
jgi:hypothetical protein